jgi:membrane protein insertase Oxa1/YidC/SpoIIIJ
LLLYQGVFLYWAVNNVLSITQTKVLKLEPIRKFFNIPKAPLADATPPMKFGDFGSKVVEVNCFD